MTQGRPCHHPQASVGFAQAATGAGVRQQREQAAVRLASRLHEHRHAALRYSFDLPAPEAAALAPRSEAELRLLHRTGSGTSQPWAGGQKRDKAVVVKAAGL